MRILVEVKGGVVSGVWCSEPEGADVVVRDMDNIEMGDEDPMDCEPGLDALRVAHFAIY